MARGTLLTTMDQLLTPFGTAQYAVYQSFTSGPNLLSARVFWYVSVRSASEREYAKRDSLSAHASVRYTELTRSVPVAVDRVIPSSLLIGIPYDVLPTAPRVRDTTGA